MAGHNDSLETKVLKWLSEHGFPLEMHVAEIFQKHGARVIQSEYYIDPVSGDAREVDLVAYWQEQVDDITVRLTFVVECKSSKEKPWVVFTSPNRLAPRARVLQRAATKMARYFLSSVAGRSEVQALDLFRLPLHTAYGGKPAFTEPGKADSFHAAISSVCAAAASESDYEDHQDGARGRLNFCEVVLPLVVIDTKLFAAGRAENGDVQLEERDTAVLVWRNPVLSMPNTIVDIVTAEHIDAFVRCKASSIRDLLGMCAGELRTELVEVRNRRELQRALKTARKVPAVDGP